MPKIRNLRVINACFNEARRVFQDFKMPFHGENATYELINGGGKSVLLMLMLQCVLPKESLDPKKPFKDIFRGGDPNRTTHVLVEWELDEQLCDHKYLLTGFCAKKKANPDEMDKSGNPDHFTYIHAYDRANEMDIHHIPLCRSEGNEFVTVDFSKARDMLREKSHEYDISIFEGKNKYIQELKKYNLLDVEMNLIRRINKKENYFKSHFTENYGTSRTLVEKLLVDTTQRCLESKANLMEHETEQSNSESLASALFNSQEQIRKLSAEMEKLEEYGILLKKIHDIKTSNEEVLQGFSNLEELKKQACSQLKAYEIKVREATAQLNDLGMCFDTAQKDEIKTLLDIEELELKRINAKVNVIRQDLERLQERKEGINKQIKELSHDIDHANAVNKYLKIKDYEKEIRKDQNTLSDLKKNNKDLFDKKEKLGGKLHFLFKRDLDLVKEEYSGEDAKLKELNQRLGKHQEHIGFLKSRIGDTNDLICEFELKIKQQKGMETELQARYAKFPRITGGLILKDELSASKEKHQELSDKKEQISEDVHRKELEESGLQGEINTIQTQIKRLNEDLERLREQKTIFEADRDEILKLLKAFDVGTAEHCLNLIETEMESSNQKRYSLEQELAELKEEIRTIREHGSSLSKEMKEALEWFKSEFGTAYSGAEYLKGVDPAQHEQLLERAPWLMKSLVLMKQDFNRIVSSPSILPARIQDFSVIIINQAVLQEDRKLSRDDMFIPAREAAHYIKLLDPQTTIAGLERRISKLSQELDGVRAGLEISRDNYNSIRKYLSSYPEGFEEGLEQDIKICSGKVEGNNEALKSNNKKLRSLKDRIEELKAEKEDIRVWIGELDEKLEVLNKLDEVTERIIRIDDELKKKRLELKGSYQQKEQADDRKAYLEHEMEGQRNVVERLRDRRKDLERSIVTFREFAIADHDPQDSIEILYPEYDSVVRVINNVAADVENIGKTILNNKEFISGLRADIKELDIPEEELTGADIPFEAEYINGLKSKKEAHVNNCKVVDSQCSSKKTEYDGEKALFDNRVNDFERPFEVSADLLDETCFDGQIRERKDELVRVRESIKELQKQKDLLEGKLGGYRSNHDKYLTLDSYYHFRDIETAPARELIDQYRMSKFLSNSREKVQDTKRRYEIKKRGAINAILELKIPHNFTDTIKNKLDTAEDLQRAVRIQASLTEYENLVNNKIEIQAHVVKSLEQVEEKVLSQALGFARLYRDHLKRFPALSKIRIDGRNQEMIRINFKDCEYSEELAHSNMQHYVKELIEMIEEQKLDQMALADYLTPSRLIGRILDMKTISLSIRKIDTDDTRFQKWEKIQASDGQENAMFIIFIVVLMSYMRDIVVNRAELNSSKLLIIDNPFGSTSAFYLWEKIASILKTNDVQLICPTHKINSEIGEYFPIRHVLTQESDGGRVRIQIKTSARDDIQEEIDREKRYGQLGLESYG